ncbi:MAG: NUDIX hydrolase, partial [Cyanobacteria bacterium P01_H01_bin.130]
GQALDALVIACVDVVLIWGDRILLGERRQPPRPGWWVIGGRMIHGESPIEAVQRKLREEAGLGNVAGDRLSFIGVFSTRFSQRGQPPTNHGLHSINLTYRLELTDEEAEGIILDKREYGRSQWWNRDEIADCLNRDTVMDQALRQILTQAQQS